MYSLLLKDLLLTKKTVFMSLAYALFILIVFQNEVLALTSYIMGAIAITYFFVLWVCAYDEKDKTEIFLNSLPIPRKSIVAARYSLIFVYMLLALVMIGGLGFVLKTAGLPFPRYYLKPIDILAVFVCVSSLFALYLPVFFYFGYHKARAFNMVLFLLFFFIPNLLVELLKKRYALESLEQFKSFLAIQPSWALVLPLVSLLLLLLYLSYRISLSAYNKREF